MVRQLLPFVLPEALLPPETMMVFMAVQTPISSIHPFMKHSSAHLLQFIHMWKSFFHKLSSSFPQFERRFPHLLRMWKTYQHCFFPHVFFHISVFFQATAALSLWKTMWKVWKYPHFILPDFSTFHAFCFSLDRILMENPQTILASHFPVHTSAGIHRTGCVFRNIF